MMEGVEFDQAHRLGEAMDDDGGEYDAGFDLPADFDAAFLQFSTDFSIPETDLFDGLGLGSDYVTRPGAGGDGSGSDESVSAVPVARKGKRQATATSASASAGPNAGSNVPPPAATTNASASGGPIAVPASGPSSGPGSHASQNTAGDTPTTPMTGGAFELQPLLSERESFAFSNFLDKVLQDPMIDPKETDELFPFMDPSIQPPQMHLAGPPGLPGHPGPAMHPGAHPQHQPPPPHHHMGPPTPGIAQAPTPTGMHMGGGGGDSGPSTPASGMGPIPGTPDELRLRVPSIAFDALRQQQHHHQHQHQHQHHQHGMTPPSPGMSGQLPPHMAGPQHPYQPSPSEQIHMRAMAETLGHAGVIDSKPPTPGHLAPHISELMSRPLDAQQQAHMRRVSASSVSTVSSTGVAQMPQMGHAHHPQMTPGGMQSPSPGAGPMPMPPHHPHLHTTHPGMPGLGPGPGPGPSPVQAQVQAQMPGQPQPASRTPNRATSASRTPGAQNGSGKKREVLTPAQKRKNHVDSEKRRRDLIRTHFEEMCKLVPRLNEGPDSAAAAKSKSTVLFMVYDHLVFLTERNKMIRKLLVANGVNVSHIPDAVSAST